MVSHFANLEKNIEPYLGFVICSYFLLRRRFSIICYGFVKLSPALGNTLINFGGSLVHFDPPTGTNTISIALINDDHITVRM